MNDHGEPITDTHDVATFCQRVEAHLARVNDGHLIRIVGPAFDLVRTWALEGVPLALVMRGIDRKAERHRAGHARRPLRLEFCELDVRDCFDQWRRAIGILGVPASTAGGEEERPHPRTRPSLARHLERAVDRLARTAGRLELSETFRDRLSRLIDDVTTMRAEAKGLRGDARNPLMERLDELDRQQMNAAAAEAGPDGLDEIRQEAAADLAAYRDRLDPERWERSLDLTADRLLRDRFGLPTLTFDP